MPCQLETNSTHKAEIVPVEMRPHPAADLLSVIPVFGYTYVGRTADWVGVKRAAYIPPDSVVDTNRPEFAFLADKARADGTYRVKAMKLRQVVSFGLMVPVPDDTPLGEDWAERLGVVHYEPPTDTGEKVSGVDMGGENSHAPEVAAYKYDLDAFRRYHHLFVPGEPVVITEKEDGSNSRFVCIDGQMYCGSREHWKKEFPDYSHITVEALMANEVPEDRARNIVERLATRPKKRNLWWDMLAKTPALEAFCRDNPGVVVYGEIFGNTANIKYGFPEGNRFAAFDLLRDGRWVDAEEARRSLQMAGVPVVPIVAGESGLEVFPPKLCGVPYSFDLVCSLAEGDTLAPGAKPRTMREGVVVKPLVERFDPHIGRVCLKCVSVAYYEKYRK